MTLTNLERLINSRNRLAGFIRMTADDSWPVADLALLRVEINFLQNMIDRNLEKRDEIRILKREWEALVLSVENHLQLAD